jgi:hypothetical protein
MDSWSVVNQVRGAIEAPKNVYYSIISSLKTPLIQSSHHFERGGDIQLSDVYID